MYGARLARQIGQKGTLRVLLAVAPAVCLQGWGQPAPRVLTDIGVVRALSPAEAAKGLPVHLTGVATYSNAHEQDLFIESGDGWIYVQPGKSLAITPGSRLVVDGKTGASYSTQIVATSVRVVGSSPLPKPVLVDYNQAVQRENDCRYVTMQGIVRAASYQTTPGSSLYLLRLETDGKMVDVVVQDYPQFSPDRILDATVRITGALGGTFDATNDRIVGLRLNVWSSDAIEVVRAGDAVSAGHQLISLAELLKSNEVLKDRHRVFTSGIVTLYDPGEMLVVQDGDASLLVKTRQMDPVNVGQRVEVTGFASAVDGVAGLDSGQFSILPGGVPATPHDISFADAMTGLYSNKLVAIEGEVISQTREGHLDTIILRSGNSVFPAVFRKAAGAADPFPTYPRGTRIEATGVCMVHLRGFWGAVESFQLHVRSPQDVAVVKVASWWTLGHLFLVTSLLFGFTLTALAWGMHMRRRLLKQEKLLRQKSEQEATRLSTMARMERQRSHILELINSFQPLPVVLSAIQAYANEMWAGCRGYLHVLENRKLMLMTRGQLSQEAIARLGEVDPSTSEEACAEAVRSHGPVGPSPSRSVWSRPILSSRGATLGTMTFESNHGGAPVLNLDAFEFGCNLAAIAIDNRRLYEDVLHRSEHDQLTGLANRTLVHRRLEEALDQAHANQRFAALLYLDLDDFKSVNDSYTHRVGDAYLVEVAQRFKSCLRECDTLGRIGGDEFIAVLTDLADPEIARGVADRLVHAMDEPFLIEGHTIPGAVSIGLAFYPSSSSSAIGIMQFADHAMYAAKRAGGNRVSQSEPDLVTGSTAMAR